MFFHNDSQGILAIETRDREATRRKSKISTEILPFVGFFLAEGYHQKYYLPQRPDLMREFTAMYPKEADFVNSTAAARVNGHVAGYGTYATLLTEISGFGLSPEGIKKVLDLVYRSSR